MTKCREPGLQHEPPEADPHPLAEESPQMAGREMHLPRHLPHREGPVQVLVNEAGGSGEWIFGLTPRLRCRNRSALRQPDQANEQQFQPRRDFAVPVMIGPYQALQPVQCLAIGPDRPGTQRIEKGMRRQGKRDEGPQDSVPLEVREVVLLARKQEQSTTRGNPTYRCAIHDDGSGALQAPAQHMPGVKMRAAVDRLLPRPTRKYQDVAERLVQASHRTGVVVRRRGQGREGFADFGIGWVQWHVVRGFVKSMIIQAIETTKMILILPSMDSLSAADRFAHDGYLQVDALIDSGEVGRLRGLYDRFLDGSIHTGVMRADLGAGAERKEDVKENITQIP